MKTDLLQPVEAIDQITMKKKKLKFGKQNKQNEPNPSNPSKDEEKKSYYKEKPKKPIVNNYDSSSYQNRPKSYNNSDPFYVLMVSEKPSIALAIAEAICGKEGYQSKRGSYFFLILLF